MFNLSTREGFAQALLIAKDPRTPSEDLSTIYAGLSFTANNTPQGVDSMLAALARNPSSDPALLLNLMDSVPQHVGENISLPLLVLENPQFVDDLVKALPWGANELVPLFFNARQVKIILPRITRYTRRTEYASDGTPLYLSIDEYRGGWVVTNDTMNEGQLFYNKKDLYEAIDDTELSYDQYWAAYRKTEFPSQSSVGALVTHRPPRTLGQSKYPEFDRKFAEKIKKEHPEIWAKGGNIRGNAAYELWKKARMGKYTPEVEAWVHEREAWIARHYGDFRLAGVIAQIKWGTIGRHGEEYMKGVVNDVIARQDAKKRGTMRQRKSGAKIGDAHTFYGPNEWGPELLKRKGKCRFIGPEMGSDKDNGISIYRSLGEIRLVYREKGVALSGLGLSEKGNGKAQIELVYTVPRARGRGLAGKLLDRARKIYKDVVHSTQLSPDGRKWKAKVGQVQEGMAQRAMQRVSVDIVGSDSSSHAMMNPDVRMEKVLEILLDEGQDQNYRLYLYRILSEENPSFPLLLMDNEFIPVAKAYDRFLQPDAEVLDRAANSVLDNADAMQGEGGYDWEDYVAEWSVFCADWHKRFPHLWTKELSNTEWHLRDMLSSSRLVQKHKPPTVAALIASWMRSKEKYRGFDEMIKEQANYVDPVTFIPGHG